MEILGHIHNGVVVFDQDPGLPEGAVVTVLVPRRGNELSASATPQLIFPLVPGKYPGSVELTNDRIAEILDEEDASA